jgi:hypothetical protein
MRLWINSKTKTSEIFIEGETRDIIKHMSNYNIRKSITKRKPFVFREFLKDFLGSAPRGIFIPDNMQQWLHRINKINRKTIACAVSEKRYSLADNIPRGIKRGFILFAEFEKLTGAAVIGVLRT